MPPPSSGGVALAQLLKGAQAYRVGDMGHNSAAHIHMMVELERRAYADRASYLGDPDFVDVPVDRLVSDAYVAARMAAIDPWQKPTAPKFAKAALTAWKAWRPRMSQSSIRPAMRSP